MGMEKPGSNPPAGAESGTLRLGISSCLLGEKVRYDTGHKQDSYITGTLGRFFELIPICPEVGAGLGVPRQPIQLVGDPDRPRVVGVRDAALDATEALERFARKTVAGLPPLDGYIVKSRSPSCGMERVEVSPEGSGTPRRGRGVFTRILMESRPLLPVEQEERLGDPDLRDNFLERVFAYRRWRMLVAKRPTPRRLVEFHTAHKLALLAHGTERYRRLGRLVSAAGTGPIGPLTKQYGQEFMAALTCRATLRRHVNALQHAAGYLKRTLDAEDRAELTEAIEAFRLGQVPRLVPVTLLQHHFRRHPDAYITGQVYLYPPDPRELLLRGGM